MSGETMEFTVGMTGTATLLVTKDNTAKAVGSGSLDVFATPMMIALMEMAAVNALAPAMAEDSTSVGTAIAISHVSATPIGHIVTATATVTTVDRRRVDFTLVASDEAGEIGSGTHSRFVVDAASFQKKADEK